MDYGFSERLRGATREELVALLNGEVGKQGWVTARGFFLSALRDAFVESGLDCSGFIDQGRMRLVRVKLEGDKVVPIQGATHEPEAAPVDYRDSDDQAIIDELIRSLAHGDGALTDGLGAEVAARQLGDPIPDEMGIIRPFDELEDEPNVGDEHFQADGTNEAWAVLGLESSSGTEVFIAITIAGDSFDGVERRFMGGYSAVSEAKAALKSRGYLDADDYRQRSHSRRP